MATYGKSGEVRKMTLGALAVRTVAVGLIGLGALAGGNYLIGRINGNGAVVEPGYVSPKSLSIQGRKNAQGNIEGYLNYKNGDETVSLPCMKGPNGPLCGKVEYWWKSIGSGERSELVESEWPELENNVKHGIMTTEMQKILDTFYGAQSSGQRSQQQPKQQYQQPKQK